MTEEQQPVGQDIQAQLPDPACVVKVSNGRGFIIEYRVQLSPPKLPKGLSTHSGLARHRLVVTAAHCLPKLPPAHAGAYTSDRTYKNLLGRVNDNKNLVWAECLFADPVADIAVLGCPDNQEPRFKAHLYSELTDNVSFLSIGGTRTGGGWVLSLDGQWVPTNLKVHSGLSGRSLWIDPTEGGMSGSPILNDGGQAVGVVVVGRETESTSGERRNERCGPQPILTRALPGWLLPTEVCDSD